MCIYIKAPPANAYAREAAPEPTPINHHQFHQQPMQFQFNQELGLQQNQPMPPALPQMQVPQMVNISMSRLLHAMN